MSAHYCTKTTRLNHIIIFAMNNIQKVTVELKNGRFRLTNNGKTDELNPKALILCATAQCAGYTVMEILGKSAITPKSFEITIQGELDTEQVKPSSRFTGFTIIYNVECKTLADHKYVSDAIHDTQHSRCGLVALLKCAAPVSYDTAIVSTETAKA